MSREITVKYEGRCTRCGKAIPAGVRAYWQPEEGIWHLDCGDDKNLQPRSGKKSHFELYEDRAGEFRWRLIAPNGEVIAAKLANRYGPPRIIQN